MLGYDYDNDASSSGVLDDKIQKLTSELHDARQKIDKLQQFNHDLDRELADTGAELASTIIKLNEVTRRLENSEDERKSLIMELDGLNDQLEKHEQFMKSLVKILKSSHNMG
ncbi:MAG: hypothetical protein VZR11_09425 [Succinimonas sp.]|jgi:chromosome segregation ATPase|nr:hypothetical protein [Succinimonas sp.]